MIKKDNAEELPPSNVPALRARLPENFLQALRDINRYRVFLMMVAPEQRYSNAVKLSPIWAAILALLWELDSRQKGPVAGRIKASDMGEFLGMNPNAVSAQTIPMSEAGFCKELEREPGQDRRVRYYVITDQGREALNAFVDQQYKMADEVYKGADMKRAAHVLELVQREVKSRIDQILLQIVR